MSWLVAICIAIAFFIYYSLHSKCHLRKNDHECKVCLAQRKLQLVKPVKTAIDVRSTDQQPRNRQQNYQQQQGNVASTSNDRFQMQRIGLDVLKQTKDFYPNERNLPFKSDIFRTYMELCTEFAIEYLGNNEHMRNVTAELTPGFLIKKLPSEIPETSEKMSAIFKDINKHILPGLTHWQHPRFMAFYPHGCSYPDMLAEFLIASIGVVQFSWDSSPAFTELEILMVNWLGKAIGLPDTFLYDLKAPEKSIGGGAFQSSSSDAIFTALIAARDRKLSQLVAPEDMEPDYRNKRASFLPKLVLYASTESHSSIEKAAQLAMVRLHPVKPNGIGDNDGEMRGNSMRGNVLEYEIKKDLEAGFIPFYVHATSGTTQDASFDNLEEICTVAEKFGLWVHTDAAYGGGAMICPEHRYLMWGIDKVNSVNVNAHKLLLSSCTTSILWTRDQKTIRDAFTVNGAYLQKTQKDAMDFRHWGVNLSRRTKALKLWMIFRLYGLQALRDHIRRLVRLTERLLGHLREFQGKNTAIVIDHHNLTLITFRVAVPGAKEHANKLTIALCDHINRSHKLLVTHARANDLDIIRLSINHERYTEEDVDKSWEILRALIDEFLSKDIVKLANGMSEDKEIVVGYEMDDELIASTLTVNSTEKSTSTDDTAPASSSNSSTIALRQNH